MNRPAAEWFRISEKWMSLAEGERLHNRPRMAKAFMHQHIQWRKRGRELAREAAEEMRGLYIEDAP